MISILDIFETAQTLFRSKVNLLWTGTKYEWTPNNIHYFKFVNINIKFVDIDIKFVNVNIEIMNIIHKIKIMNIIQFQY
jgi:hypothetical protein